MYSVESRLWSAVCGAWAIAVHSGEWCELLLADGADATLSVCCSDAWGATVPFEVW